MITVEEFSKKINLPYTVVNGKYIFETNGYLDLRSLFELPAIPTFNVGGYLDLRSLVELPTNTTFNVGGYLDLRSLVDLPENTTLNVDGSLYLYSLVELPENTTFNVGGSLDLRSLVELPANTTFNVGGSLYLYSLVDLPENTTLNVGGYLDLSSLVELPANTTFNVGGSLDLRSLVELPANTTFNVGGSLYLYSLVELPTDTTFNVGGSLYLKHDKVIECKHPQPLIREWEGGRFIKVDGIFCEVIKRKSGVFKYKKLGTSKVFYVASGGTKEAPKYAHGDSIKDAKASLVYKIGNRDTTRFKGYTLETKLSLEESIECYRVITGACEFGVKNFIQTSLGNKPKKQYTIKELIKITKNQYGHESFSTFFK